MENTPLTYLYNNKIIHNFYQNNMIITRISRSLAEIIFIKGSGTME